MDVEAAIRARRTHKEFGAAPVEPQTVADLLDLARFAPNHKLTQPWRFRVLGPETRAALAAAVGEKEAAKLRRAPTLILATAELTGDPVTDEEDLQAVAAGVYAVLLGATARGLASYWRTPAVLTRPDIRELLGLRPSERIVALIHLGPPVGEPPGKSRDPLGDVISFLP